MSLETKKVRKREGLTNHKNNGTVVHIVKEKNCHNVIPNQLFHVISVRRSRK